MPVTIASTHLSDDEFVKAVESCELPLATFRHGDHLRLAWWYLHQQPFERALESVRKAIMCLAEHNGLGHIFHETRTIAWVRLLNTHRESTFEQFITQNEGRLSSDLLNEFWTPASLQSDAARMGRVSPDRAPLPN